MENYKDCDVNWELNEEWITISGNLKELFKVILKIL